MKQTPDTEQIDIVRAQQDVIRRGDAFERLLQSDGWRELYGLHSAWAEQYAAAARTAPTENSSVALDALRCWQLAEELLKRQADYIDSTIAEARRLSGNRTLEEVLIMERMGTHVHDTADASSDNAGTADSTGY